MRKITGLLMAATLAGGTLAAAPQSAEARGWRGGGVAAAVIGGVALASILGSRHSYGYYGGPAYYGYGPRYYSYGPSYAYGYYPGWRGGWRHHRHHHWRHW